MYKNAISSYISDKKNKMKKYLLAIIAFLFITNTYAQTKKEIEELKTYSLCSCVNKNYSRIDSTFYSADVTNSYIFQHSSLSVEKLGKLDRYIEENTFYLYKEVPYGSYDTPKANMIFYFCMSFYESKKLDKFIKNLLKEKQLK